MERQFAHHLISEHGYEQDIDENGLVVLIKELDPDDPTAIIALSKAGG